LPRDSRLKTERVPKPSSVPAPPADVDHIERVERARCGRSYSSFNKYAIAPIKPIRITAQNGDKSLVGVVISRADKESSGLPCEQCCRRVQGSPTNCRLLTSNPNTTNPEYMSYRAFHLTMGLETFLIQTDENLQTLKRPDKPRNDSARFLHSEFMLVAAYGGVASAALSFI
jgi:hypothetical protein